MEKYKKAAKRKKTFVQEHALLTLGYFSNQIFFCAYFFVVSN